MEMEASRLNGTRASLSLAVQQSGWNPVGLNVKQMCPINLRRSPGSRMKTNVRAASGTIHPAGFGLSHYSPVASVSRLGFVYSQVTPARGLYTTSDVATLAFNVQLCYRGMQREQKSRLLTFFISLIPNFSVGTLGCSKNNVLSWCIDWQELS